MRFQKELNLVFLLERRIAGDPGRMEEIFEVLKQGAYIDGALGIMKDLGEGVGWGLTSPSSLPLSLFPMAGLGHIPSSAWKGDAFGRGLAEVTLDS